MRSGIRSFQGEGSSIPFFPSALFGLQPAPRMPGVALGTVFPARLGSQVTHTHRAGGLIIRGAMLEDGRYGIDCWNQSRGVHRFQIPPPRLFGRSTDPSAKATDIGFVNVLCPDCKHVYPYTAQDVRQRLFRIPDRDLLQSEPICVAVEFLCDAGGCRTPLIVHGIKSERENNAVVIAQLREATFHVLCHDEHTPHFDSKNVIHVEDTGPFSPF
jgi:hypothetical protein